MDSQAGDKAPKKGGVIPLSQHPQMDRLADIVEKLPADRQEEFKKWLEGEFPETAESIHHGGDDE